MTLIAILLILIIIGLIDNHIGKTNNNPSHHHTYITNKPSEKISEISPLPSWQLYSGTLMYMPAHLKADYLQSNKWKELKLSALSIADDKCECCGNSKQLELHHITYERLTQERAIDMAIVCRNCHQQIHSKLGYDRATKYPIH